MIRRRPASVRGVPTDPEDVPASRLLLALACLTLASAACNRGTDADIETGLLLDEAAAPSTAIVFTPDAEIAADTAADLARWAAATGLDLRIGDGGIRVQRFPDEFIDTYTGRKAEGRTGVVDGELVIQMWAGARPVALLHEIGHAIQGRNLNEHVTSDPHAVMTPTAAGNALTAADLSYVCETRLCTVFQPETE